MRFWKRLKFAWSAFKGIPYKDSDSSYQFPNRIVQLITFQDFLIALDCQGNMYEIRTDFNGFPSVQLMMWNPVKKY